MISFLPPSARIIKIRLHGLSDFLHRSTKLVFVVLTILMFLPLAAEDAFGKAENGKDKRILLDARIWLEGSPNTDINLSFCVTNTNQLTGKGKVLLSGDTWIFNILKETGNFTDLNEQECRSKLNVTSSHVDRDDISCTITEHSLVLTYKGYPKHFAFQESLCFSMPFKRGDVPRCLLEYRFLPRDEFWGGYRQKGIQRVSRGEGPTLFEIALQTDDAAAETAASAPEEPEVAQIREEETTEIVRMEPDVAEKAHLEHEKPGDLSEAESAQEVSAVEIEPEPPALVAPTNEVSEEFRFGERSAVVTTFILDNPELSQDDVLRLLDALSPSKQPGFVKIINKADKTVNWWFGELHEDRDEIGWRHMGVTHLSAEATEKSVEREADETDLVEVAFEEYAMQQEGKPVAEDKSEKPPSLQVDYEPYPEWDMPEAFGPALPEFPESGVEETYLGSGTGEEWEGELVSLDLKEAPLTDVLRFFSVISGLNIVMDPEVTGNVSVHLIEVPWDQALELLLRTHGYGMNLDGNVLRIAPVSKLAQEEAEERQLKEEQELNAPLVTRFQKIAYAKASSVKNILDNLISRRGSIIVDERTNTLIIKEVDVLAQQRVITDLIDHIDKPTSQVEIEARIVETTKTFTRAFGIQWGFSGIADAVTGTTSDLLFPNNFKINGDLLSGGGFESELPNEGWAVNLPAQGANAALGLQFGNILDTVQLDIVLTALENDGYGRILSAPKVTTQNNTNAVIESGSQIPYQTIANNTVTTTFVSASLKLNVTPQITGDDTIIMDIIVEQNAADFAQSVAVGEGVVPSIATRSATTQVLVPNGGTTVIGGIFQMRDVDTSSRIPWFHKIPILGMFFQNRSQNRDNTELLIFISPTIKRPQS
ncbi:type IV pilus secretin PilQ [Acidobacteriota bacterium]